MPGQPDDHIAQQDHASLLKLTRVVRAFGSKVRQVTDGQTHSKENLDKSFTAWVNIQNCYNTLEERQRNSLSEDIKRLSDAKRSLFKSMHEVNKYLQGAAIDGENYYKNRQEQWIGENSNIKIFNTEVIFGEQEYEEKTVDDQLATQEEILAGLKESLKAEEDRLVKLNEKVAQLKGNIEDCIELLDSTYSNQIEIRELIKSFEEIRAEYIDTFIPGSQREIEDIKIHIERFEKEIRHLLIDDILKNIVYFMCNAVQEACIEEYVNKHAAISNDKSTNKIQELFKNNEKNMLSYCEVTMRTALTKLTVDDLRSMHDMPPERSQSEMKKFFLDPLMPNLVNSIMPHLLREVLKEEPEGVLHGETHVPQPSSANNMIEPNNDLSPGSIDADALNSKDPDNSDKSSVITASESDATPNGDLPASNGDLGSSERHSQASSANVNKISEPNNDSLPRSIDADASNYNGYKLSKTPNDDLPASNGDLESSERKGEKDKKDKKSFEEKFKDFLQARHSILKLVIALTFPISLLVIAIYCAAVTKHREVESASEGEMDCRTNIDTPLSQKEPDIKKVSGAVTVSSFVSDLQQSRDGEHNPKR